MQPNDWPVGPFVLDNNYDKVRLKEHLSSYEVKYLVKCLNHLGMRNSMEDLERNLENLQNHFNFKHYSMLDMIMHPMLDTESIADCLQSDPYFMNKFLRMDMSVKSVAGDFRFNLSARS